MVVSNEELDALQGLPLGAQVLYLRELRRHMDYATGVVGVARRISWQGLGEALYVEPHPGLKDSGSPGREQVRRLVKWLEKARLVRPISDMVGKQLIFRLPLAVSDDSVQKQADRNPTETRQTEADRNPTGVNSSSGAGLGYFESHNPTETRQGEIGDNPTDIRYPLSVDGDEIRARARGDGGEGGSPGEVGESDGNASAGVATADFRLLLGQDGAPVSAVLQACVRVAAVQRRRDVSELEMLAAIADARSRGVRSVAGYAATIIESGSLVAAPPAKVVPFAGRGQAARAGSALDGILAAAGGAMGYD